MPQYRTFNLGDAIAKGQSLSANRFRLGEAQRNVDVRGAQEEAIRSGDTQQFSQQFPIEAKKFKAESRAEKLDKAIKDIDFIGNISAGMNEQNYLSGLQRIKDAGGDISDAPAQFDPNYVQSKLNEAGGYKEQFKLELERLKQKGAGGSKATALQKNIPTLMKALKITEGQAAEILTQTKDKSPERWRADLAAKLAASGFHSEDEAFKTADSLMKRVFPEDKKPAVRARGAVSSVKPGEKTATDAKGNKVVFRGGKWLPVK